MFLQLFLHPQFCLKMSISHFWENEISSENWSCKNKIGALRKNSKRFNFSLFSMKYSFRVDLFTFPSMLPCKYFEASHAILSSIWLNQLPTKNIKIDSNLLYFNTLFDVFYFSFFVNNIKNRNLGSGLASSISISFCAGSSQEDELQKIIKTQKYHYKIIKKHHNWSINIFLWQHFCFTNFIFKNNFHYMKIWWPQNKK